MPLPHDKNSMPMNNNVNNEYNHANMNSNNDMQNNSYPNNNVETNNNAPTYQVKQEFNWTTIGGIACGIISLFIFWWLSLAGISIEIKALKDINDNNQKGKIVAYIGLFVCIKENHFIHMTYYGKVIISIFYVKYSIISVVFLQ